MKLDKELLDRITTQAQESPRLRMNYNLHTSLDAGVQRMFNALEPGTVMPIHRHQHADETYIVVRGGLRVMFYNDDRSIKEEYLLNPLEGGYGVHIPRGEWHSLEVLESGTVIFEVKEGPYTPITPENLME